MFPSIVMSTVFEINFALDSPLAGEDWPIGTAEASTNVAARAEALAGAGEDI